MRNRHLILVGFMGTGKTSSGRIAADALGLPLYELDAMLEARAGKTIPAIFEEDGEATFRDLESELVNELATLPSGVVATGGGVILRKENTDTLNACGLVVCLQANSDTVLQRVASSSDRPLLEVEDRKERVRSLLAQRAPLYDALPVQVKTDGRSSGDVAEELVRLFRGSEGA